MPSTPVQKQRRLEQQAIALRDQVLKECGWPIEKRRRLLGGALRVYQRQLEAEKAIVVDGQITQVPDNQAQLRAAEAITTLEGVNVGKSQEGGSTGPISITINAPWFQPETTISRGSEVIESGPDQKALINHD